MATTVINKNETAQPISSAFIKMIERKRQIQEHIRNGGSFEELTTKGYQFVQPI